MFDDNRSLSLLGLCVNGKLLFFCGILDLHGLCSMESWSDLDDCGENGYARLKILEHELLGHAAPPILCGTSKRDRMI